MTLVGWHEDPELGVLALVLQDEQSGDTLELQRFTLDTAQDRDLGMDGPCVVHNGCAHYGGLEQCSLVDGLLLLRLSAAASEVLELPRTLELALDRRRAALVEEHLERFLEDIPAVRPALKDERRVPEPHEVVMGLSDSHVRRRTFAGHRSRVLSDELGSCA